MSWTDERVSRLTKLWQDGLSASQIAADLGGVTRNAVIGKVHRLGMSNRDKPPGTGGKKAATAEKPTSSQRRRSEPRRAGSTQSAGHPVGQPASQPGGGSASPAFARTAQHSSAGATMGNAALKMEMEEDIAEAPAPQHQAAEDVVIPISRKLDLLQLTESTCKWPTGDPTMPGFSFCGHQTSEDKPYCEHHAKIAFQPPSERRRRR